jgi:hypothetical protein
MNAAFDQLSRSHATRDAMRVRAALVGVLRADVEQIPRVERRLRAVGAPQVTDGAKLQAALAVALTKLTAIFTRAERQARSLPVRDLRAFTRQASALADGLKGIGAAFSPVVKYDSPRLDQAANKTPSCVAIGLA